ncbi:hypothetical protein PAEPH01_2401 [Pancytospora epiphaga]|nr:hypothetical protein PAEPH01_2401 [Pancytospora epiphaga]
MPAIRTNLVNGRELKKGDYYISNASGQFSILRILEMTDSKPGKHGSAKTNVTARNILNDKQASVTFKDTDEKILQVLDFSYVHKVVYSISDSEICVSLETGESVHMCHFESQANKVKDRLAEEQSKCGSDLKNSKGFPMVIKYSEVNEEKTHLLFWDIIYVDPEDLPRHGITDYVA